MVYIALLMRAKLRRRLRTMSDKLKKRLYAEFLIDTPIQFDSVTDEQWQQMLNTHTGAHIALAVAADPIRQVVIEIGEKLNRFLNDLAKQLKRLVKNGK